MKILKKLGMFGILIFGLQAMTLQGAQESKDQDVLAKQIRQEKIKEAIKTRPNLVEGFYVLQANGLYNQSYQGFVDSELSYDEDEVLNFSEVVSDATDLVVEKMKKPFLAALNNAIQNNIELTKIYDPVFLYVMKYKDGFLQLHIRQWVNEKDKDGDTPLYNAANNNNVEIVKLLIAAGADLNIKNFYGYTPLHIAVERNNVETLKLLIDAGANLNIKDNYGDTPLCEAARNNKEVAILLIAAGANVNIKDNEGETPLHIASGYNNIEIAKLLIDVGADVNIQNDRGQTAEQQAKTLEMRGVFAQARKVENEKHEALFNKQGFNSRGFNRFGRDVTGALEELD